MWQLNCCMCNSIISQWSISCIYNSHSPYMYETLWVKWGNINDDERHRTNDRIKFAPSPPPPNDEDDQGKLTGNSFVYIDMEKSNALDAHHYYKFINGPQIAHRVHKKWSTGVALMSKSKTVILYGKGKGTAIVQSGSLISASSPIAKAHIWMWLTNY